MAQVANTYDTYSVKGIREDLRDQIYNIAPEDVPVSAMIKKSDIENIRHEWQTDTIRQPAANAQVDGDEYSYNAVTPTVRVSNISQIMRETYIISGTTEAVKKAGRKSELAYQGKLKMAALKRDLERAIIGANTASVLGNSSTARLMGSLPSWLTTNVDRGATGANGGYNSGTSLTVAATDGTARPFTKALLDNVHQQCYTAGGSPSVLMLHPTQKRIFSGFSGIAQLRKDVDAGKQAEIVGGANIYVGDFGDFAVQVNRWQRTRDAWLLDPDFIELGFLRSFQKQTLAKTGDAEKRAIIVEATLIVKNEAAMGVVADLA
jgi:Family of unknown function (DUF5309)